MITYPLQASNKYVVIPFTDSNQLYSVESYFSGNAPYISMIIGTKKVPIGTYLYNERLKDGNGNLLPFHVTSYDVTLSSTPPSPEFPTRINIIADNKQFAAKNSNFSLSWQYGGSTNLIVKPTPTTLGIVTGMPGTTGLIKTFDFNNSPSPATKTPLPPTALGGSGITTNYIPPEIEVFGNGGLKLSDLLSLSFTKNHQLFTSAATAFEQLVADARSQSVSIPSKVDMSYMSYNDQLKAYNLRPSLNPTPGKSIFGWGLTLLFNKKDPNFTNFKEWLKLNAYKYNIYGLRADPRDKFYVNGFIDGVDNQWDYRGPISFSV
jgi:hypothetical protein